jgi:hypothetical protein
LAADVVQQVRADFKRRNPTDERAALREVPRTSRPAINRGYPPDEALATVPPLLLGVLPPLPDNLEYRFFGRHVVILDADLQLVVDYIPDALPPH